MEIKLEKVRYFLAGALAICWSLFQIYGVWNVTLDAMILRAAHVGFALSLAFVLNPSFKSRPRLSFAIDSILMLLGIGVGLHIIADFDRIIQRIISVDEMTFRDLFFGFVAIPLILEATRRTVRAALAIVGTCFCIYLPASDRFIGYRYEFDETNDILRMAYNSNFTQKGRVKMLNLWSSAVTVTIDGQRVDYWLERKNQDEYIVLETDFKNHILEVRGKR